MRWLVAVICLAPAVPVAAQSLPPAPRLGITDNSFLVEEAFNQEAGVFQNIFVVRRTRGGLWDGSVTQEWPLGNQRHQGSFTIPFSRDGGVGALGDILVNYRWQASTMSGRRPAFSPRVSVLLPSSRERRDLGLSGAGWQVNLPVSHDAGVVHVHWNVGATWLRESSPAVSSGRWTTAPFAAASIIWGAAVMVHPLLEVYGEWTPDETGDRPASVTVLPGIRTGWNFGDRQLVVGVGVPVTRGSQRDTGVLAYLSFELPFVKK